MSGIMGGGNLFYRELYCISFKHFFLLVTSKGHNHERAAFTKLELTISIILPASPLFATNVDQPYFVQETSF